MIMKNMRKSVTKSFNPEIIKALEIAEYRMLRQKALLGQDLVQADDEGNPYIVSAKEVFEKLYNEKI